MNRSRGYWFFGAVLCILSSFGALARGPLTFEERVAAQTAIERVYYEHRIWPKENPGPKPPFEVMCPKAQIEAKVTDYLKECTALEKFWQRPITPEQLQAEMDRMARDTKDPAMLRELFAALGDDPLLIVECLAGPSLADHFVQESYEGDSELAHRPFGLWWEEASQSLPKLELVSAEMPYLLPDIIAGHNPEAAADTWTATSTGANCPSDRYAHTAIWTGAEMIVWGGTTGPSFFNTAGRYNPATDTWATISTGTNCPSARAGHTCIWTGTEVIIWGGYGASSAVFNTGGRYNPATDSWVATSTGLNCPIARCSHSAVWTGSTMIIWGGSTATGMPYYNSGAQYDPSSDTWASTSTGTNCPAARGGHAAVWSGTEMIVWGGVANFGSLLNTGGRYNPATDTWTAVSSGLDGRCYQTAVWTGTEMTIWGGYNFDVYLNTGGRYNPTTDSWTSTSTGTNCPTGREYPTAIWTGTEMIVWGGYGSVSPYNYYSGGRYNPLTNLWTATSTGTNCPVGRSQHTAVWTGGQMIVWGGGSTSGKGTGGQYFPYACSSPSTPAINSISDNDPCTLTGISITFTSGSGATSHDLYKDGLLAVTGYISGSTYSPGDSTSHTYVVRALNLCGYTDSAGMSGTDAAGPCSPPPEAASGSNSSNAQTWTDKNTQSWPAVSGATSYTLYRGAKADLPNLLTSGTDSCTKYTGISTSASDAATPSASQFFWYLVTASNANGEGTAGNATEGVRVVNSSGSCP